MLEKIKNYFQESYNELRNKVSWPTWPELQNSTTIVMVASVIIALVILLMDFASSKVLDLVYSTLG